MDKDLMKGMTVFSGSGASSQANNCKSNATASNGGSSNNCLVNPVASLTTTTNTSSCRDEINFDEYVRNLDELVNSKVA